jgi:tRNA-dihydrouridine synthase B
MYRGFWDNLKKPIIGLSPMDGVSDAPFRQITAKYGQPSLLITEFTSVEALNYGGAKALEAFIYSEVERPVVAQIYGRNPESFYKACFVAAELGFDGIDINMGCPSKSVSGNGAGAALIREPMLAQEIIQACQQAVKDWREGKTMQQAEVHKNIIKEVEEMLKNGQAGATTQAKRQLLPISVKTRIGYDAAVTEEWIKNLLECQPANLSLHGRTLKQMYTGRADWEEIAKAAKLTHQTQTTLLGNGDVESLEDAQNKMSQYGVDGVLIGRATFGNPWIFQGITKTIEEKLQIAIEHSRLYEQIFAGKTFDPMKKHLGWYCKDFPHAKELRLKLMTSKSADQVEELVKAALPSLPSAISQTSPEQS